ncbi:hypothetical protein ACFYNO_32815 [Kitasatospora sp. NPDC006697]|uniref:hypothetical protein n=1 Tax=Kitasatospora sp. NPDC006697 TaxID=3364020 RepID=UPI003694312B
MRGDKVGRRNLKYAVVHLQAAVECLLKYRLELEHWTLVFKNPGEARCSELDDGSLTTCTVDQTLTRLTDIAGVTISELEKTKLAQLAELRNRLQHYGRHHDAKVNRYVIEANAAYVLEFLIHFLNTELVPRIPLPDADTLLDMAALEEGLNEVRGYVTGRMRRLRPQLDLVRPRTVQCPSCDQLALVVGDEEAAHCLYCHYQREADEAAMSYAEDVLGRNWHSVAQGGPDPVACCPTCDLNTLVTGALTAAAPDSPVDLCFHCGEAFSDLEECGRCGTQFDPTNGDVSCASCEYDMIRSGN